MRATEVPLLLAACLVLGAAVHATHAGWVVRPVAGNPAHSGSEMVMIAEIGGGQASHTCQLTLASLHIVSWTVALLVQQLAGDTAAWNCPAVYPQALSDS